MHHLIGLGSCLCLSLHHSISSVITHMPRRGGRPDNGRLKGPWARQRGAAVCRRGNRATSPNYPSTALGKTQWGRSLATPSPHLPPELPHSHPPTQKKRKVLSWVCGGDSNWWLFKLDAVCLPNISALVWMSPRRAFACLEMRSMEGGERASAQNIPYTLWWQSSVI